MADFAAQSQPPDPERRLDAKGILNHPFLSDPLLDDEGARAVLARMMGRRAGADIKRTNRAIGDHEEIGPGDGDTEAAQTTRGNKQAVMDELLARRSRID